MKQSVSIDIDAPAARVYEVMSGVEAWPTWTASIRKVTLLDGGLRVGARAAVEQPRLPRAVWTVTSLEAGREFVWEATGPGIHSTAWHTVEETGPGRSRATLSIEQQGPLGALFGRIYRGLTDRYLALEAAGLKSRSEEPSTR
ncbi:polyketide cyclase [Intrasporangium oryzae NRRL B-24470]|uniref:Polyketide cyclase n=1 Tax=Intrasporangium oryzae NRRL B-24470 TaxID=1386089 RepID=W9G854_9MICO|nr:SRPBCC family protein [Intrasporangium oryzae]EWT02225.1 polyketide cyclase [Intrasporangium oryzae NRRL B-24470]